MKDKWQLQEAKNMFSNVVKKARNTGPQIVTKHGKDSVVILSCEAYEKLIKPDKDIVSFFKDSPLYNSGIDTTRDKSPGRDVEL